MLHRMETQVKAGKADAALRTLAGELTDVSQVSQHDAIAEFLDTATDETKARLFDIVTVCPTMNC